jgi:hypothetical protein
VAHFNSRTTESLLTGGIRSSLSKIYLRFYLLHVGRSRWTLFFMLLLRLFLLGAMQLHRSAAYAGNCSLSLAGYLVNFQDY